MGTAVGTHPAGKWAFKPRGEAFRGLKVGLTTFSPSGMTLDATIALLKRLDISYVSLKPFHLALESTPRKRTVARRKISDSGLALLGCGLIELPPEERGMRAWFDYASDIGAATMVVKVQQSSLRMLERIVRDYEGIRVAIHTHGPEKRDPFSSTSSEETARALPSSPR